MADIILTEDAHKNLTAYYEKCIDMASETDTGFKFNAWSLFSYMEQVVEAFNKMMETPSDYFAYQNHLAKCADFDFACKLVMEYSPSPEFPVQDMIEKAQFLLGHMLVHNLKSELHTLLVDPSTYRQNTCWKQHIDFIPAYMYYPEHSLAIANSLFLVDIQFFHRFNGITQHHEYNVFRDMVYTDVYLYESSSEVVEYIKSCYRMALHARYIAHRFDPSYPYKKVAHDNMEKLVILLFSCPAAVEELRQEIYEAQLLTSSSWIDD